MEIYLDNSATTKPYIEVVQDVQRCMLEFYANPSSIHSIGEKAKKYLDQSRRDIAASLNSEAEEIIFTSGGSESNNFALKGLLKPGDHMITTSIEHSSILKCCFQLENTGVEVTYLNVDKYGKIDLEHLKQSLKEKTKLVSIMHVNNETGIIQDIGLIGKLIKGFKPEIIFHVDAVQSYGKLNIDVNRLNIDLLSISAHKIHGPKGVGAIYVSKTLKPCILINGGGQEYGLRAGTENLPGIVGFSTASKIIHKNIEENFLKVSKLRETLIEKLQGFDSIKINSINSDVFSPYIVNFSIINIRSGKILFYLDEKEIYVSKSSACSSRKLSDSHVLKAMNLQPDELMGSLRISFSEENTLEDVDALIYHMNNCLKQLKN